MVLKKKEIIAASLVVLIGVAGYLNWSYQDTIRVQDGESYVETGKKLGEAQYVSSDTVAEETSTDNAEQNDSEQAEETAVTEDDGEQATDSQESNVTIETASDSGNYFEQAKMNKETSRSKSLEILNQTAENESFDADIRKKAGDKILEEANNVQKESEIESIPQLPAHKASFRAHCLKATHCRTRQPPTSTEVSPYCPPSQPRFRSTALCARSLLCTPLAACRRPLRTIPPRGCRMKL